MAEAEILRAREARRPLLESFLDQVGWGGATCRPLAGDASRRSYYRLDDGERRAVLMDAPPPHENARAFVKVARHLTAQGYSAPQILAADEEAGVVLLEDLGDDLFRLLLEDAPERAEELYGAAVDLLVDLHERPEAGEIHLPPYNPVTLAREAALFVDWYMPAQFGGPVAEAAREAFEAAWAPLFDSVDVRATLVLRDYHADNLIWLPEREGVKRVGLLDFQDALLGNPAYDLVSLLEDARRDVDPRLAEAMIARYAAACGLDKDEQAAFRTAYAILGAQRNMKIIGIFSRLAARDGKPRYLDFLPRVWRYLEGDIAHPALEPVKRWLDEHVPHEKRGK